MTVSNTLAYYDKALLATTITGRLQPCRKY